jgi:hypothetical protein
MSEFKRLQDAADQSNSGQNVSEDKEKKQKLLIQQSKTKEPTEQFSMENNFKAITKYTSKHGIW